MGAAGAIIMSFFGAVFASITLATHFGWTGAMLLIPFAMFAITTLSVIIVTRLPGRDLSPSRHARLVILWSSALEGIGIGVAATLVSILGHREFLLPAIAMVVGLHFFPMAIAISFRPFYVLGGILLVAAAIGLGYPQPLGSEIAGFTAAVALWVAAVFAVRREMQARDRKA